MAIVGPSSGARRHSVIATTSSSCSATAGRTGRNWSESRSRRWWDGHVSSSTSGPGDTVGGGFEAIVPGKARGKAPKLSPEQVEQLKTRLDAGPREADGVCTFRGIDIVRIIKQEFGVVHTLGGIYDVLKRIGYSSLAPRPSHRKKQEQAVEVFVENAPFLSGR
jgi:transposase